MMGTIRSMRYIIFILLLCAIFCPSDGFAFRGYVQKIDQAVISWGDGQISAQRDVQVDPDSFDAAYRSARALRDAAVRARRNLLDAILSVRIDSSTTVAAFLHDNDAADARVRHFVQNSRLTRPDFVDGKGVVTVSAALRGKLAEAILPTTIPFESGIAPRLSLGVDSLGAMNSAEPTDVLAAAGTYTGLVVDASALVGAVPALSPVVYGRDGEAVYGAFIVSRASAVEHGIVAYSTSADRVVLRERVGKRPLVVQALGVSGNGKSDFIISGSDAFLVRTLMKDEFVRKRCAVVVVLSPSQSELSVSDEPTEATKEMM
jgi:hypothetical protein